jgi:hypothetical protein
LSALREAFSLAESDPEFRPPMEPLPRNRALLAAAKRLGCEVGIAVEDAGLVGGGALLLAQCLSQVQSASRG